MLSSLNPNAKEFTPFAEPAAVEKEAAMLAADSVAVREREPNAKEFEMPVMQHTRMRGHVTGAQCFTGGSVHIAA
tara:strand:- start:227 stop:451 length:225 start_codon:yes stop_codon:yes gene_type:complete